MSNIIQFVNGEKNLTMLKKTVNASGLNEILSGSGPFTLFAPSDHAFEKLDETVLENLLEPENKAPLSDVLNSHIIAGKINFTDLKDGQKLETVNGKELLVQVKNGKFSIEGAAIQHGNVKASNGFIHSLDMVIMKN